MRASCPAMIAISLMLTAIIGCSSAAPNSSATSSPSAAPTLTPIPRTHATRAQLLDMQTRWDTANALLLTSGDSILGEIATLLENPDERRDYPILLEAPDVDAAVRELPAHWETTHQLLHAVGDNIITARTDFKKWIDGADLDDDLTATLKSDSSAIADAMCSALDDARA